jgi:HSP20 family protein
MLTVKGEKREEHEEKGENVYRVERSFGCFSRMFRLPCEVREDQIKATYKDGVLDLRLPKSETAKKKSIKITVH